MNILIVDGNEREASSRYTDMGMDTQYLSLIHISEPTRPERI